MFDCGSQNGGIRALRCSTTEAKTGSRNVLDDLTGKRFGLLEAVQRADNDKFGTVYWQLRCTCGAVVTRRANTLRAGKFFTCGAMACRFWEKVDKNGPVPSHRPELGSCWVWTGALKDTGYGVMKAPGQKKNVLVHVYSYGLHTGPAPEGRWVLHHCDNRLCVRPDHLFPGTHQDNMDDMAAKGRNKDLQKIRLLSAEKDQMRTDYQRGGVTHVDLVKRYGVSLQTVGRILRGESN